MTGAAAFPDAGLARRWEGQPLAPATAWGLPLVREGRVLRNAGADDLPSVVPDLAAPLLDGELGDAALLVLHDLVDEDGRLGALELPGFAVPGAGLHLRHRAWAARFDDDPEGFCQRVLSTKRRKRLRYDRRQLEKRGEVTLAWVTPAEADREAERFLALTRQRACATGRYDAVLRHPDRLRAVWRRHAGRELLVSALRVDGRTVSFRTGFAAGDRYLGYMPAVDRDLDGVSVGDVHLQLLLPELAALGISSYHMGKGGLGNKDVWASEPYTISTLVLPLGRRVPARLLAAVAGGRQQLRRAVTASGWEVPLRRGLHRALTAVDTPYRRALQQDEEVSG
jgi:CelD/BcsL family acetyltransferase involved in cellulose biosynthesis